MEDLLSIAGWTHVSSSPRHPVRGGKTLLLGDDLLVP